MNINIEQFLRKMHATCEYLWQKEKMSQNSMFYYSMKMSQNNMFYYFMFNMKRIVLSFPCYAVSALENPEESTGNQ